MQQMWNKAEARENHSTDLTGRVAANPKKAARQNQTDNSGFQVSGAGVRGRPVEMFETASAN